VETTTALAGSHAERSRSVVTTLARAPLTLTVAYVTTIAVAVAWHPMWLDELQAWCIARDAHSIRELFWNMRYDGHPSLWYLCLYALTRFTDNPAAMQVLHVMIATTTVGLIAWRSPFTPWERWLLAFGYLFAFEFAVISRAYGLGVLLLLAACHWSSRIEQRMWPIALALVGLANTSIYGTILAICLLGSLGVRFWFAAHLCHRRDAHSWRPRSS